jgi:hypothetical protein
MLMMRLTGPTIAVAFAALVTVAVAPACREAESSLVLLKAVGRAKPPDCSVSGEEGQASQGEGTLDLSGQRTYIMASVLKNQLTALADPDKGRTETATIMVEGATVRVEDTQGKVYAQYTDDGAVSVKPGGSTSGYSTMVVNTDVGNALAKEFDENKKLQEKVIISYVSVFGRTLGGVFVKSNEFRYPITVCNGCLRAYVKVEAGNPVCVGVIEAADRDKLPCIPGQDQLFDCRIASIPLVPPASP